MELTDAIVISVITIFCYMTLVFIIALIRKDNSIVDSAWGLGFIVVALVILIINGEFATRQLLVTILVATWGFRLAINIFIRNRGKGEDFRYRKWRQDWGKSWVIRSYLQVFILQGFMMLLIATPFIIINSSNGGDSLYWLDILGVSIWLFGFLFETIGDYQLRQFVTNADNKGKVMDTGLWRYSRHPNYFGEVVQWWGIFVVALAVPQGWLGVIGPLTISLLILKVSGVPLLEKSLAKNPAYQDYKMRTSVFVPLPPKRGK
jgi:steroid 5-alpha reductase family enzyme